MSQKINLVTGAFSYSGRYISQLLIDKGEQVRNLTNHPNRKHNFGDKIQTFKMDLDNKDSLLSAFQNVHTLYCTYWVRFNNYQNQDRQIAINRAKNLIQCAQESNVKKIIYTSHTQSSVNSPLAYIRGKAIMEEFIKDSGISYGFVKPCAIFGDTAQESILFNNLAYVLRHSPVMAIPGNGKHPVQPVHVRDLAELCVKQASSQENFDEDAVGPEILTFQELVETVKANVLSKTLLVKYLPPQVCYYLSKPLDYILKDKFIEDDDLQILTKNYMVSHKPPTGKRKWTEWIYQNRDQLGIEYLNSTDIYYKQSK